MANEFRKDLDSITSQEKFDSSFGTDSVIDSLDSIRDSQLTDDQLDDVAGGTIVIGGRQAIRMDSRITKK